MARNNYFNTLTFAQKLDQLGRCRLMPRDEFRNGVDMLRGQNLVIVGCGAQGLHQGLNMRDSGLDVSYTLRDEAIRQKRDSWKNATDNGFKVGTYEQMIPTADVVLNLTPDKQHSVVAAAVVPLMKNGATLSYSHGFNIVEEGAKIRKDITVILVAPKSPGTQVRQEYTRGFGVPTLIAVHPENDPDGYGLDIAKAYAVAMGGDRAGVLESSFVAEVKSDLMGEQTILCGMLQAGSILCYDKMVERGIEQGYASALVQFGWETLAGALKHGGITTMMDQLDNPSKIRAFHLAAELKDLMRPLYAKHQDDIITGNFSSMMMADWDASDTQLLTWRAATAATGFERSTAQAKSIAPQEHFDNGLLMVAVIKAGVELTFECMTAVGMKGESAYFESLHEIPLIASLISRNKLREMNRVISDTAEYGGYLFSNACIPRLRDFMAKVDIDIIGSKFNTGGKHVDDLEIIEVNASIQNHPVEIVGRRLRGHMKLAPTSRKSKIA
jgi:ketol-acid reductoisomerase